ncbi:putative lipid II flippase FtsW [bacterium]|nr:MAG: putative lipid II flippase FtsW [bacterium]
MRSISIHKNAHTIIIPVLLLSGIGLLMVYSSSVFVSLAKFGNSFHYLWRHLFNLLIGFTALVLLSRLDYHVIRIVVKPLLILSFILLVLVFVPGIGVSAGEGSAVKRWINLGFFTFQPSELVKICIVIFMADYISRNAHKMKEFRSGVIIPLAIMVFYQGIILLQPDFGAVMSIGILTLTLLFIGGMQWRYLLGVGAVSIPVVCFLIVSASYRVKRILCFLDPWRDSQGCGYQLVQSFLAFGRGGFTGVGIGDSKQKLFFLPEAHNDFIYSLVGEETGFVGVIIVLGIFLYLFIKLFRIAMDTDDSFGYYLALGLTTMIVSQALINFAVTIGLMPTKGLPLPFISYGGSSLLVNLAGVGILISIARNNSSPLQKETFTLSGRKKNMPVTSLYQYEAFQGMRSHDRIAERRRKKFTIRSWWEK